MKDRYKIDRLQAVEEERYTSIALDYLVMYALAQLHKIGADLSYENAVAAAFRLFPKRFSLIGFPDYPDAKRVHDCLFRCTIKPKFWLGGKTSQGFILAEQSAVAIAKAESMLSESPTRRLSAHRKQRRKEMIATDIESSAAYAKYKQSQMDQVTNSDVCFLLGGTLDSTRDLLRENLKRATEYVKDLGRGDLVEFLEAIGSRFRGFLRTER